MFALVRHAHAGEKKRWEGPDLHRPLTRRGKQQAEGVAETLRIMQVDRLLSSPALRCIQTLAPLATRLHRSTATHQLLGPGADPPALDRLLTGALLEGSVLCTHGENIKGLFAYWRKQDMLQVRADDPEAGRTSTEKGATWLVEADGDLRTIHYLRPLHVGPVLEESTATQFE